jgi:hypothetical protein
MIMLRRYDASGVDDAPRIGWMREGVAVSIANAAKRLCVVEVATVHGLYPAA